MTDVMDNDTDKGSAGEGFDDRQLQALVARARAEGLQLTGEGGLLARLTKLVVESALEGEMDDHLGYAKNDPTGRDGGNSRNGKRRGAHRSVPSFAQQPDRAIEAPGASRDRVGGGFHRSATPASQARRDE